MTDPNDWRPVDVLDLESSADDVVRSRNNTLVIAGPGAGKTELLAQRTCFLLETGICQDPARILAVSFKRDAARNLKDRVAKRVGRELSYRFDSLTFDSFSKGLLDRFTGLLPDDIRPTLDYQIEYLSDRQLDVELLNLVGSHPLLSRDAIASIQQRKYRFQFLQGPIDKWRNVSQDDVNSVATSLLWKKLLKSQEKSSISFPMIGRLVAWMVGHNEKLRKILYWSYPFVFLDEFQDTTGYQYEVLYKIFLNSQSCLTAVGDHKQRIMLWAGASRRIFNVYQEHFSTEVKRLCRNYRCAQNIAKLIDHLGSIIDSDNVHSKAIRNIDGGGEVQILRFRNEDQEASVLADRIEEWKLSGIDLQKIVIIARNNTQDYIRPLSEVLQSRNIQCRDDVKVQEMIGCPLSSYFINMLRLANKKGQPEIWNELIFIKEQSLGHEVDDDSLSPELNGFLRQFRKYCKMCQANETQVSELIWKSIKWVGCDYFTGFHHEYRRDGELGREINETSNLLATYLETRSWSEVLDYIDGIDCVRFMTIHKSKGLEFDRVIFLGLEDNAFWNFRYNQDEETCNFFVALSRARDGVYFTTCQNRVSGPRFQSQQGRQSTENIISLFDALRQIGVPEINQSTTY